MIEIQITEYVLPNGRQVPRTLDLPDEMKAKVDLVAELGCSFSFEVLRTGKCVAYIANNKLGLDPAMETCFNEEDKIRQAFIHLLSLFTKESFEAFKAEFYGEETEGA